MVLQLNSFCFCRLTAGMSCGHSRELSPTDNDNPIRQEWDVKQDNFTNTLWNGHSRLYRQLHAVLGGGQAKRQVRVETCAERPGYTVGSLFAERRCSYRPSRGRRVKGWRIARYPCGSPLRVPAWVPCKGQRGSATDAGRARRRSPALDMALEGDNLRADGKTDTSPQDY